MAQVANSTLVWLWDQLLSYTQPRVAYNDIAAALSRFPSLQPKTDTYHFENGRPALLVCLVGTLPVDFRGKEYRYPVEIWVPKEYGQPGAGIICYVRPSAGRTGLPAMVVRPGQHVAVDGRIYHPYLRDWATQTRSNIVDFLDILQGVFSREPPLIATTQNNTPNQVRAEPMPAVPPKPQAHSAPMGATERYSQPPPLPSKPGSVSALATATSSSQEIRDSGPPLPPLPQAAESHVNHYASPPPPLDSTQTRFAQGHATQTSRPGRHPVPMENGGSSPISPISPTYRAELPGNRYDRPPPLPHGVTPSNPQLGYRDTVQPPPQQVQHSHLPPLQAQQYGRVETVSTGPPRHPQQPLPHLQHGPRPKQQVYQSQPQPFPDANARPVRAQAPDLLTDPFDITLGPSIQSGPPPPIPPNPEKEHLLSLLAQSFGARADAKIGQSQAALGPLTAQRQALLVAQSALQSEIHQLQSLEGILTTNENILRQSIRDCNAAIESSRKMPQPNIDEVLVAPTIAAQQLWNLCAEEAGIREALWCLQRAVGVGRISGAEFVRLTRSLAREAFLKMALARKVAKGLGLEVPSAVHR